MQAIFLQQRAANMTNKAADNRRLTYSTDRQKDRQ